MDAACSRPNAEAEIRWRSFAAGKRLQSIAAGPLSNMLLAHQQAVGHLHRAWSTGIRTQLCW